MKSLLSPDTALVIGIALVLFLLFVGYRLVAYLLKCAGNGSPTKSQSGRMLAFLLMVSALLVVAYPHLAPDPWSDSLVGNVLVDFTRLLSFVALVVVGGFIVFLACKLCLYLAKIIRLWLHRKISRISFAFAIVACCVMIALPFFVCALFFVLFDVTLGKLMWEKESIADAVVKSYLYAISSVGSVKDLSWGGKVTNIFFGLIGYLIFSGFTVSMFVSMIQKKMDRITNGEEHYPDLKSHYVVIGSGVLLESLVERIFEEHKEEAPCNIVVLSSESIPELRKRLDAKLREEYMERLVFVHGDRTNKEDLQQLALASCKVIYLMGDFGAADQDDRNLASLTLIDKVLSESWTALRGGMKPAPPGAEAGNLPPDEERKQCKIYLERYHTHTLFQGLIKNSRFKMLTLEPVCFYKYWSEVVLGIRPNKSGIDYHLLGDDVKKQWSEESFVHLVIIGMSRMGMTLATEAAMHLHFPNAAKKRTRITMIDRQAYREMCTFRNLHQNVFSNAHYTYTSYDDLGLNSENTQFGEPEPTVMNAGKTWLDTEFHFIQGNAESKAIRELLVRYSKETGVHLVIAVCLPDDRHALSLALALPNEILRRDISYILEDDSSQKSPALPVVLVQQQRGAGLLGLLRQQNVLTKVFPFGMVDEPIGTDAECDKLAVYLDMTYNGCVQWDRKSLTDKFNNKEAVEEARRTWKNAEEWKRISNRYAMASRTLKLRSLGIDENDLEDLFRADKRDTLETLAELEHNRWCMEKLMIGYRPLSAEEQAKLDVFSVACCQWSQRERKLKKEEFVHPALRPWIEITSTDYKKVYYAPTINTCLGICLMPTLEKEVRKILAGVWSPPQGMES